MLWVLVGRGSDRDIRMGIGVANRRAPVRASRRTMASSQEARYVACYGAFCDVDVCWVYARRKLGVAHMLVLYFWTMDYACFFVRLTLVGCEEPVTWRPCLDTTYFRSCDTFAHCILCCLLSRIESSCDQAGRP